tara:strand:- start:401 stop:964 length:564 start_codon:yes stop_codon:yes gene_type:complete
MKYTTGCPLNNPFYKQILKTDAGFSLLELVVVIAVLAILASVALPTFTGVTRDAKISATKTSLTNIMKECISTSIRLGREAKMSEVISASSTFNPFGDRFGLNFKSDGFTYDTSLTSNQQIIASSGCYKISAKSTTDNVIDGKPIGRYPHFMIEFSNGIVLKTCSVDGASTFNKPRYCDTTTTPNSW